MCVHAHVETMAILDTIVRLLCEFSVEKNNRLTIGRLVIYRFSTSVDHNHEWMQGDGNVKAVYKHDHRGHFAAYRSPDSLADDVHRWFGDRELSGSSVF